MAFFLSPNRTLGYSLFTLIYAAVSFSCFLSLASSAEAKTTIGISTKKKNAHEDKGKVMVCEVRCGKRILLVPDYERDEFIIPKTVWPFWKLWEQGSGKKMKVSIGDLWDECRDSVISLLLPEGFPESVTRDYLEYSLWRRFQGVATQVSGVLATQALLYSVGLGKGAIPIAEAVHWVLKDGIGYLSKIMFSNFGRHFDVNPKGWRLFPGLLENTACGMEILIPAFPYLFIPIGTAAGAGRSVLTLI